MPAAAKTISWTDWTSETSGSSAVGELSNGIETLDVKYSATTDHVFVQTGTGINYWTGDAYTKGEVDNAPTPKELIALSSGGTVTILFEKAVKNPYIALTSWNSNVVDFGVPITFDSVGTGYWGSGTYALNAAGTGFTGIGELHGVIKLVGLFDTITFKHTSERWHGFTVGVAPVPLPAAGWLFVSALAGFGLFGRRAAGSQA